MITSLFFLVLLFFYAKATPFSFNLPTIQHNDSLINCTGDAYISSQGIQVTRDHDDGYDVPSLQWRTGRATCTQPMHLWDTATGNLTDFSTNFSFIIRGSNYGEGLAFFLAPNGSNIPPNSTGGGLGLINENQTTTSTGVNRFVAVEFDTYRNNPWQEGLPINHVGINVNSRRSSVDPIYWPSGISNGRTNEARIKYNSSTQNLSVSFFGFENDTQFTQGLFLIVDLRRHLPEWVTFGFSASTGDSYEKNTIRSWEFTASFPSDERVEEAAKGKNKIGLVVGLSAGLGVVVGGIALVWFVLCRKAFLELCFFVLKPMLLYPLANCHTSETHVQVNITSSLQAPNFPHNHGCLQLLENPPITYPALFSLHITIIICLVIPHAIALSFNLTNIGPKHLNVNITTYISSQGGQVTSDENSSRLQLRLR
ncbi:hypothetical protein LOK49_LG02G03133 [Camellia lanceoleosa]|uniref:Uncharacterized protein n=1 Tax=Camellia lanceoleosa TaxID=1840588 RepID=A0ACC0IL00_9ERIC|nr:hypothetical protein LOK49_LG02G03133 [Camellia lanceoleosa]